MAPLSYLCQILQELDDSTLRRCVREIDQWETKTGVLPRDATFRRLVEEISGAIDVGNRTIVAPANPVLNVDYATALTNVKPALLLEVARRWAGPSS